jgi:hypothetical protein
MEKIRPVSTLLQPFCNLYFPEWYHQGSSSPLYSIYLSFPFMKYELLITIVNLENVKHQFTFNVNILRIITQM